MMEDEMAALIFGRSNGWVQKMEIGYKHEASIRQIFWLKHPTPGVYVGVYANPIAKHKLGS